MAGWPGWIGQDQASRLAGGRIACGHPRPSLAGAALCHMNCALRPGDRTPRATETKLGAAVGLLSGLASLPACTPSGGRGGVEHLRSRPCALDVGRRIVAADDAASPPLMFRRQFPGVTDPAVRDTFQLGEEATDLRAVRVELLTLQPVRPATNIEDRIQAGQDLKPRTRHHRSKFCKAASMRGKE